VVVDPLKVEIRDEGMVHGMAVDLPRVLKSTAEGGLVVSHGVV
jgi:hypothetical protein